MKFANATKFDRKSGVAEWRDLRLRSMGQPSFVTDRDLTHGGL